MRLDIITLLALHVYHNVLTRTTMLTRLILVMRCVPL